MGRKTGQQGGNREDDASDQKDPPPAQFIGQAASGDDQHSVDEQVAIDNPLGIAKGDVHVALDARQSHVEGGQILRQHQVAKPQRQQGQERG